MALRPRDRDRSYRLSERIALGGMGEVYKATSDELPRPLAVKRVLEADTTQENLRLLFLREVAVAATLEHHHVVEMIDAGAARNDLFLVMEYVDGPSLAEILDILYREGRLLPVELACGIVSQVAVGLAHAHERALPDGTPLGIIHRDVAVENILIGRDGIPKLLDFGLAKIAGHSLTEPGVVRGRPRSLSPEQARGDHIDARSDLFALGAILFELISGEQLYPNESVGSLLFRVASGNYESIAGRVPSGTDPDLIRIVDRALAVDPNERFASARQLERELAAFRAARGMRLSARELSDLVDSVFPRVMEVRQKLLGQKPGELEGEEVVLPRDSENLSGPHHPVRTPRLSSFDSFQPMPQASERSPGSDSNAPASGPRPWEEPFPYGAPASGQDPGPPPRPTPDAGPDPTPAGSPSSGPGAAVLERSLSEDLAASAGISAPALDSALPRPARPGRFADGSADAGWWWYGAAMVLVAGVAFIGIWVQH